MSRRASAKKRPTAAGPDPIYRSRLVSMMISRLLIDGKKNLAARLFYESLDHIRGLQVSAGTNLSTKTSSGSRDTSTSQNIRAKAAVGSIANANTTLSSGPQESLKTSESVGGSAANNQGLQDTKELKIGLTESSTGLNKEGTSTKSSALPEADALKLFQQAIVNVTPVVEVKSRRVGGSNFQVPLEVSSERGTALALKWIVQAARQRPGREMSIKLANELMDASNKTGNAIRKREETHKNAEANKAFANYRF